MKLSIILLIISFSVFADYSGIISCEFTQCEDIEKPVNSKSWCSEDSTGGSAKFSLGGFAVREKEKELVIDLSDGDQVVEYVINKSDIDNERDIIRGEFRDGFWWDQLYWRFKIHMECTLDTVESDS